MTEEADLVIKSEIIERLASRTHPRRCSSEENDALEAIIHAINVNKFTLIENRSEEDEE